MTGWSLLFSSRTDGRSLHTLAERTSGYAHGTLLVVRDRAGFVFAGWAARGLNPNPPSALAPPREPDFSGCERTALLRLLPSLRVFRTRRQMAASEKATAAASGRDLRNVASSMPFNQYTDSAFVECMRFCLSGIRPEPPENSYVPSSSSRREGGGGGSGRRERSGVGDRIGGGGGSAYGLGAAGTADAHFLYFNNRRSGKRGVGFGGTLRTFRLFVDASLERGTSCGCDETFAEGALASSDEFEIEAVEVWGCGGDDGKQAQEEWKEEQSDARKRALRRELTGYADEEEVKEGGVLGGVGKEDRWMLGLLGRIGGFASSGA